MSSLMIKENTLNSESTKEIDPIEHNEQRILTTELLAFEYGTDTKIISNNFNRNKDRYVEGKHYYCLQGELKRSFIDCHQIEDGSRNAQKLYLWTEKGAFLHAKSLNTDEAWEVYEKLVESYFTKKEEAQNKKLKEGKTSKTTLASVNNAVKIIGGYMKQAGITEDIQLLTVKGLYAKADVYLPLDIEADKVYYDTKQIAHKLGMRTKANKPAYHAVSQIIKELDIFKDEVKEVWETNGSWQGVVKKYSESIVDKIEEWLKENDYPDTINSDSKKYYVLYEILV